MSLRGTSVRDAVDSAVIALTAAGCETPRLDAEVLLAAAMGVDRAALIADPARELSSDQAGVFRDWAFRRRNREPVAYIVGRQGFRWLDLHVDKRVLVPRPETEHLVEAALGLPEGARVADVGTGSGAVALALKSERPDLQVVGTDISEDALAVARGNAARLGLDVTFVAGDLLAPAPGPLDAVVSNPPYVREGERLPPDVGRYEPHVALFAPDEGLAVIDRLVPQAAASEARFLALEVGEGQAEAVAGRVREAGFAAVEIVRDYAGIDRVVVGRR